MESVMSVKRAEAARILNVSKARITQYVKDGMPSLADGSIDIDAARRWLNDNIDPAKRAGWATAKAQREPARRLGEFVPFTAYPDPTHRGFAVAACAAILQMPTHVVKAAADIGLNQRQAEQLADLAMTFLWGDLEDKARGIGIPCNDPSGDVLRLDDTWCHRWQDRFPWHELYGPDGVSKVTGEIPEG
ncbi:MULTISPECIES: hypothetical protein [Roseomonadaceae]|uniref:Helix-turn-helix domain-containing protein n=1 Tax=Falsiroseomonas oleicola TaxID=2801474 RepID=A0ABS6H6K9_9PROT|nr:hypothetical protein [Roseomonas oleicola]MBU8544329.1 hypothetical protein [Roseomonas oleicola]